MPDEKLFADWSPASVFGATAPQQQPARQIQQQPSDRAARDRSSAQNGNGVRGSASSMPPPMPPRRRVSADTLHHETRIAAPTSGDEELRAAVGGSKRHHLRTEETGPQLIELIARPPPFQRQSVRYSDSDHRVDTNQLAVMIQTEKRDGAARVLQKYARLLLLVKREREAAKEVNALRLMLKQAAVSQLVRCYRRYRSRQVIEAYLTCWREQEARIQKLLRHVQAMKHTREARVSGLKHQWRQEQLRLQKQGVLVISQWCAARIRLRRKREEKVRVQIAEAQRQLVCWYRRRNLELRWRDRAQKARQSRAAIRIQQVYCKFCHRRAQQLARIYAASIIIAECIERYFARKKRQRQLLEAQCARHIQVFYRKIKRIRAAREELELKRRVHRGAQSLSALLHKRAVKRSYLRWFAVCKLLQNQEEELRNASIQRLQRVIHAFASRKKRIRCHESAIRIQRLIRSHQLRVRCLTLYQQRRKLARKKRKQDAATAIQARFRGFLARKQFEKLLKQLRDRFRCSNCGVIEPSGAYCKLCGRKRTNFDLSATDKRLLLLSLGTPSSSRKQEDGSDKVASGGGSVSLPLHLAPVRPASPPSFPKLQASKNAKLRMQMAKRAPATISTSSNQHEPSLEVSGLSSLPMVLSPRHAALASATPAKRPASNRPPAALLVKSPETNQSVEPFAFPSRPQPRAVNQTKLRAQALIHIQTQQQELSQTHALTQHLHRLQKASHAVSRSR